jgi:hypothetical protein
MELAVILVPIFLFVLARHVLEARSKARADRVRLLEEALKNPALDRPTIESLTFQLTGNAPPRARGTSGGMAFLLAFGWLGLFTGIGLWVLGELIGEEGATAAGILVSIIGFGFVSYPFALRELETRRSVQ